MAAFVAKIIIKYENSLFFLKNDEKKEETGQKGTSISFFFVTSQK